MTDSAESPPWQATAIPRLEYLAAQPGVEVILLECPESSEADAGLCPRLRGVARAVGNVVVFREVGSAEGSLLGLPPLWEPCPQGLSDLPGRLRTAGVERPMPPGTG